MDSSTVDYWKFVNSFATWVSALGTLLAVIVALYFSRKDKFIKLKVEMNVLVLVGPDFPQSPEKIVVSVTNTGLRKAIVTGIGGTIGSLKKNHFQIIPIPNDGISGKFPVTLDEGESASFYFPVNFFKDISKKINRHLFPITTFKILAYTSVSKNFKNNVNSTCKKKIFKVANEFRKKN